MDFLPAPETKTELVALYANASGEGFDQNDASKATQNQNQEEFFEAVTKGDIDSVKGKLSDINNPVKINAVNRDGDTALQIAIDNNNFDMMKELLDNKAEIKWALLHSIVDNNVECVKFLVLNKPGDTRISDDNLYITPTTLAAQLGHYDIVNFLIEENYLIEKPCDYECACRDCHSKSDMFRSQIAINRFRGLSSPTYMCLRYLNENGSNKDPLSQAFEMNTKIRQRARDETELKKEYLKLSDRCKNFATDLYNCCTSMKEIAELLDVDEEQIKNLSSGKKETKGNRAIMVEKIRQAIQCNHKKFVAHPHTQQLLNVVVYSGVTKLPTKSIVLKALLFILYTIFFPVLVFTYIVFPWSRVSRMMTTPFLKFISHISQFLVFLILIAASALRDNHTPTGIEYIIFITVFGMLIQEIVEMNRHQPRTSYFFKWWNIITVIMLILFALSALFWIIGFAITGGWSVVDKYVKEKEGYRFLLLGNSFFSLAIVTSVFHLIDLCQVNSVLGPLQLSLYRMLRDVLKFLLLFAAIFVAFVMGLRNLYSYYNSIQEKIAANNNKNLSMKAETNHQYSTLSRSTYSMFWALFDKIELDDFDTNDATFEITQETGKVLFAFYSICAVMVALNMLIAMMTTSYESITEDEDIQWKFSRTQLWLEFVEKGSTLPAPYNLLPNPRVLYNFFKKMFGKNGNQSQSGSHQGSRSRTQKERKTIIKRLIHRYFHTRESQRKKELGTLKDIEESKLEIIKTLRELINNRNV